MTTKIDKFRDNLRDLITAHKFYDTNFVEDENGTTQESLDPISEVDVVYLADEMIDILREKITDESATEEDYQIKVYADKKD